MCGDFQVFPPALRVSLASPTVMRALFLLQVQGGRETRSGLLPDVGSLPSDVNSYTLVCCGLGIGLQSYSKCQTAPATLS